MLRKFNFPGRTAGSRFLEKKQKPLKGSGVKPGPGNNTNTGNHFAQKLRKKVQRDRTLGLNAPNHPLKANQMLMKEKYLTHPMSIMAPKCRRRLIGKKRLFFSLMEKPRFCRTEIVTCRSC
uniref:Uncharacterized protein n=1 Tax=Micrurus lemniscatus lemniscatus TaxID=129467 RepID=A0A2D4IV47_MICLE